MKLISIIKLDILSVKILRILKKLDINYFYFVKYNKKLKKVNKNEIN